MIAPTIRHLSSGRAASRPDTVRRSLLRVAWIGLFLLLPCCAWLQPDGHAAPPSERTPLLARTDRAGICDAIRRLHDGSVRIEFLERRSYGPLRNYWGRWTALDGSGTGGDLSVAVRGDELAGVATGPFEDGRSGVRVTLFRRTDAVLRIDPTWTPPPHDPSPGASRDRDGTLLARNWEPGRPAPDPKLLRVLFVATPRCIAEAGANREHLRRCTDASMATAQEVARESSLGAAFVSAGLALVPDDVVGRSPRSVWEELGDPGSELALSVEATRVAVGAEVVCFLLPRTVSRMQGYGSLCDRLPTRRPGDGAHVVLPIPELGHGDVTFAHELAHTCGCEDRPDGRDEPTDVMRSHGPRERRIVGCR